MGYTLRKGQQLADRILDLGVRALEVMRALPKRDPAAKHVGAQLFRATSIGANYEEARAAESRDDFAHKVAVAAKEAREMMYWLQLIDRGRLVAGRSLEPLIGEASEVAAILSASKRTARRD